MSAPILDSAKVLEVIKGEVFTSFSPCELRSLLSKRVVVLSIDGKIHTGWVFTVDPVSKSIVLIQFPDEQRTVTEVIMGHAIGSVTLDSEDTLQFTDRLNQMFQLNNPDDNLSEAEIARRQTDLKQWLEKHHIPVTISGDKGELLSIAGALYIEPPYDLDNCVSANEIILGRVQALMKTKPDRSEVNGGGT